jgi:biotin-(acetyl-CoA carboxylase) ligase
VLIDLGDKQIHGTTMGIGKEGALRVQLSNGQLQEIMAGDIVVWE